MKYKLSEIADIISGGTPKKKVKEYWGGNIPWITIKDFTGKYINSCTGYITKQGFENSSTNLTWNDDILISARGTVGELIMVKQGMTFNQSIYALRVKRSIAEPSYIYYWLNHNIKEIKRNVHGSVFDTITRKTFDLITIDLPSLQVQQNIAQRISLFDKKIELNNKINANLDELMSEIFDHYIVKSKEFNTDSLSGIANYKNGLAMQKFRPQGMDKGIPVLKIKELNQGFTDKSSDQCSSDIPSDVIVNTGDVIFSWSGTLLVKLWTGKRCGLNQHLFKVTSDKYPKWFIYKWTEYYLRRFQSIAAGKATTMGHIKRSDLKQARVKIPSKEKLRKLNQRISPLFQEYENNIYEVNELLEIKSSLLKELF